MPNDFSIVTFEFQGTTEAKTLPRNDPTAGSDRSRKNDATTNGDTPAPASSEPTAEGKSLATFESEVVSKLNERSDEIASEIQREVGRLFRLFGPTPANVQADINFYEGTIVVEGTIILIGGWLGGVALQAAEKALVTELSQRMTEVSRAIGIAAQRVLRKALRNEAQGAQFEPFRVDVTPRVVNAGEQLGVHQGQSAGQAGMSGGMSGGMLAFLIADTLLLVVAVAILLAILILISGPA